MAEHEVLVEELKNWVKREGTVTAEEILEWAKEHSISSLALYVFVEEVLDDEDIDGSNDTVLIDETFDLHIPSRIYYKAKERPQRKEEQVKLQEPSKEEATKAATEQPTVLQEKKVVKKTSKSKKVDILSLLGSQETSVNKSSSAKEEKIVVKKTVRQPKKKKTTKIIKAQGGLLEFIATTKVQKEIEQKETGETQKTEPSKEQQAKSEVKEKNEEQVKKVFEEGLDEKELDVINELLKDERFEKALRYLNNYWSVGIYRFYEDMKRMGVKEPKKILYELSKKKLVKIVDPGVVNAMDVIKKLKLRKETRLSDLVKGSLGF